MIFRDEGILILSGGLTAHNLGDRSSFSPDTARAVHKEFDKAVHQAVGIDSVGDIALQENTEADRTLGGRAQAGYVCTTEAPRIQGIAAKRGPLYTFIHCCWCRGERGGADDTGPVWVGVVCFWCRISLIATIN